MLILRKYLLAIIELSLVVIALGGLLIDVRYWPQNADTVIDRMVNAGYHVEYINPQAQRLAVWVASAEQLAALTNIEGVTAISLNKAIPKR
jgi:hypothetical protein